MKARDRAHDNRCAIALRRLSAGRMSSRDLNARRNYQNASWTIVSRPSGNRMRWPALSVARSQCCRSRSPEPRWLLAVAQDSAATRRSVAVRSQARRSWALRSWPTRSYPARGTSRSQPRRSQSAAQALLLAWQSIRLMLNPRRVPALPNWSRRFAPLGWASIRTRRQTIYSARNHRCRPKRRVASVAVEIQS